MFQLVINNLKQHLALYVIAFFTALGAVATIYMVASYLGVPVKILTRDPYRAAQVPPYYAYVSLLGSTIWLVAAAGTLTTGIIAKRVFCSRLSDESTYRIIVLGGIIGMVMAVDDILLFHDAFARSVGIPEILFHLFYFVFVLLMIWYSKAVLLKTPWLLFFSALACFGLSSFIDMIISGRVPALSQSEDVFKFCAIVLWALYFTQVCWVFLERDDSSQSTPG